MGAYSGESSSDPSWSTAILSGFEISDPDMDTGVVVVHLRTFNRGVISLNPLYVGKK